MTTENKPTFSKDKNTLMAILAIVALITAVVGLAIGNRARETPVNSTLQQPVSYVISTLDGYYLLQNGTTGALDFKSTNATTVVQNAIGNLTTSRTWIETIKFKGNFSISGYITVPSYTALDLDGALLTCVTPHIPFFWLNSGVHDVTIKGGYLNGQKEVNGPPLTTTVSQNESSIYCDQSSYNLNFLNIAINGSTNFGIALMFSYNVLVQGCSINYSYNDGVNLGGAHDCRIIDNQFYYQGHVPIVLSTAYRNTIANNICLYSGQRTTFSSIHVFLGSYFNTIVGNVVGYGNGSGAHGIFVEGYQNTVADNVCTNLGSAYGIYLHDASDNTVTGNVINGTSTKGIGLAQSAHTTHGNIISDNTIAYCQDGIFVSGSSVYQNTIQNNHIVNNTRYGIYVVSATPTYTYILNNDISNNTSTGIRLEPGNYTYITGNTVYGNGGWGIHIVAATSGNNYIKNNVITNNTSGAISNSGTSTIIQYNVGFVTENSGSAVNATATTFSITHGLAGTPTGVWCSFNTTAVTAWTWTATSSTITVTMVGPNNNVTCYWKAEYQP